MVSVQSQSSANPSQEIEQPWGKLVPRLSMLDSIVLTKDSIKIGRSGRCDVVIDKSEATERKDTGISKEHCVFTKEPSSGNIYITDLSKNGTFVNGEKIGRNRKRILKDSDEVVMWKDRFGVVSMQELPDTLTSTSSINSPLDFQIVNVPIWGRIFSCLINLPSVDLRNHHLKVGRSSLCDVVIDNINPNVKRMFSKEHFVITRDFESSITCITDISNSGTYVNGQLLGKNRRVILQHDDQIAIGPKRKAVYVYKTVMSANAAYLPPQLRRKYEVSFILGKGACGEVRLIYEKQTLKRYAIKKILKARSTASQMGKLNHPSKIQTEIKILESLSHPFVIKMKEIVEEDNEVFLVLEYMEGGELNNRILSNVPLTESNVKFLFYQMVLAVQFLHSKGITHRDLKPENVLLASHDVETLIKVSDFGLSKITEEDDMMRTQCGTTQYAAPEVLDAQIPKYDKQVDVWSLGVILFYMLSKKLPFQSPNKDLLIELILKGEYNMDGLPWNGVSYFAKDLVKKMLTLNPQERITISEILLHPWLSKDPNVEYRVHMLMRNQESSDMGGSVNETTLPQDFDEMTPSEDDDQMLPPPKRVRHSSSDESP